MAPEAAALRAQVGEQGLLQEQQRPDRVQRGQRAVVLAQLLAEQRAAVARAQVAADRSGRALQALGDLAELQPHLLAGQQARLGRLGQRHAGAHEQRLHRRHGGLHRLGDLLVGQRVDLPQQQRRALRLRQVLHVRDQQPELLAPVDLVRRREPALGEVDVHRVHPHRLRATQVVQRAVAGDPVQPRPHVDLALVRQHRVERGGEHLLQHVLGVLARGQHVPAERQQARLVARHQRLERVVVALPRERDQPLVRLQPEQRRTAVEAGGAGVLECGGFQEERGRTRLTPLAEPAARGEVAANPA